MYMYLRLTVSMAGCLCPFSGSSKWNVYSTMPPIPTGLEYWTGILEWPKLLDSEFCAFYKPQ